MKNINKQIIINSSDLPLCCNGSKLSFEQSVGSDLHPKVYINITNNKLSVCPYCGIQYILTTEI